jgi:hypothetical protein
MANYYATARSNYFRIKDKAAFMDWCVTRHLDWWEKASEPGLYALSPYSESGWPTYDYNEENDDETEVDLAAELATHLAPSEVAVLMEVGNEKLRYVTGYAVAVNAQGKTVRVHLDDIYDRAAQLMLDGATLTEVAY